MELIRYIHLNPLRAGQVTDLTALDHYPWCGHSVVMGNQKWDGQEIKEVLCHFGQRVGRARQGYRLFIADGINKGRREELAGGGLLRSQGIVVSRKEIESFDARVLGSGEFVEELWRKEETKGQVRRVVSLPALVGQVALLLDLEEEEIRRPSKKRWLAEARGIIVYLAVRELGYRAYEVGKELRLGAAGVSISLRRTEVLFRNQPDLKNKIFRLLEK